MAIENCVTFLPCSDIKKTTHFYRDIVGLPVVQEQAGGMLKIFDTGYGYWGFCQYGDGRSIPSGDVGVCLSLNCHDEADVDRQYARMTEKGCVIKEPPKSFRSMLFLRETRMTIKWNSRESSWKISSLWAGEKNRKQQCFFTYQIERTCLNNLHKAE